jgi:hypothetical protein
MAAAQEFAWPKPGPEQEALKQLAGEWDAVVKCTGPDGQPQESTGTYSAKLDVGGYFLITEFKGKMLGMDFHGRGINGYDPFKKKYTGTWVDSMSPSLYSVEGEFDKAGKVLTEKMEGPNPEGKPMKMRMVTELKDKNTFVQKMYMTGPDGKEMLGMETTYTRKK